MNKCGICNKEIIIPGQEYCILTQYSDDDEQKSQGYYHVECFRQKYLYKVQADQLMERTMRLLNKTEARLS